MSWKCGEGPYGKYPDEDGYEEDLERYDITQFECEINDEYKYICYGILNTSEKEHYVHISEDDIMYKPFINYLYKKHDMIVIPLQNGMEFSLSSSLLPKSVDIQDINDMNKSMNYINITIHNSNALQSDFLYYGNSISYGGFSDRKVILDIHNDISENYKNKVIEFVKRNFNSICYIIHDV